MRFLTFLNASLIVFLLSGTGNCSRDVFDGPDSRLLVKEYGAPDSKYSSEVSVYLSGAKGSQFFVDVNANSQWFIDNTSFHSIPAWCQVTVPSGAQPTRSVSDKLLILTDMGDNLHPFVERFELVLRHTQNPNVCATIHIYRNIKDEEFYVGDHDGGTVIDGFENNGLISLGSGGQEFYFELYSDRAWQLTIRPVGFNKSEYVGNWVTEASVPDLSLIAQPDGLNLQLTCGESGLSIIKVVCAPNGGLYPLYAEIELSALSGGEVVKVITIPLMQQTSHASFALYKTASPADYTLIDDVLTLFDLNPNGSSDRFEVVLGSTSNRMWSATLSASAAGWLTMYPAASHIAPGETEVTQPITFLIQPNASLTNSRTATVTFTSGNGEGADDINYTLTVVQPAKTLVLEIDGVAMTDGDQVSKIFSSSAAGSISQQITAIRSNHPWSITPLSGTEFFEFGPLAATHDNLVKVVPITIWPYAENTSDDTKNEAHYQLSCGHISVVIHVIHKQIIPIFTTLEFAGTGAVGQKVTVPDTYPFTYHVSHGWIVVSQNGRELTITPQNNTQKNDDEEDITRSGSILVTNTDDDSEIEIVVNQDKRWWIGVQNVTGYRDNTFLPAPNLDFSVYTSNSQFPSGSLPGRQEPPFNPALTTTIALDFIGNSGSIINIQPPPPQTVTLVGWLGGYAMETAGWRLMYNSLASGTIQTFNVSTNTPPDSATSVFTVIIQPSSANSPSLNRKYYQATLSAPPALSTLKCYIYTAQSH